MATYNPGYIVPGLVTDADFSSKQWLFAKMSTTNSTVSICDTQGEVFLGVVSDNNDTAGQAAQVVVSGTTKVICAEALTAGDLVGTDASGKAVKIERTNTGADIGDYYGGVVIEGTSAANEYATILLGVISGVVESA
jgi:hypothetical protein